jgi:hypothetical protein
MRLSFCEAFGVIFPDLNLFKFVVDMIMGLWFNTHHSTNQKEEKK